MSIFGTLGFLLALYLLCRRSSRLFGTLLTPECIFIGAITSMVTLYHSGIIKFDPLGYSTWVILTVAATTFIVGSLTAEKLCTSRPITRKISSDRVVFAAIITSSVGAITASEGLVSSTGNLFGFSIATLDFNHFYDLWSEGRGRSLYLLNIVAMPVNTLAILASSPKLRRKRWLFVVLLLLNIASLALAPVKVNLARGAFLALMAAALTSGTGRRFATLTAIGLLAFFVWHTNLRSPYYQHDYGNYQASGLINLPPMLSFVGAPLVYATGGLAGLNHYVSQERREKLGFGRHSFRFIFDIVARAGIQVERPEQNKEFLAIPIRTNVYTGFRSSLDDLSWFGLSIWALYGFLTKKVFIAVRRGKLEWLLSYGILGFCCGMVFFSNHFAYFATATILGWSIAVGLFLFRPVSGPRPSYRATVSSC